MSRPKKRDILVRINDDTYLKQPNEVTYMRHDFNTVQIRALVHIIERLQKEIDSTINNPQLSLFEDEGRSIRFEVPIKEFGIAAKHYDRLRDSLLKIASISVEIKTKEADGRKYRYYTGLLRAIIPEDKYIKNVIIEVDKHVARHLATVNKGYTKYLKEIVMMNSNKYAQRFYFFISAFRTQRAFSFSYETLKKYLKIEGMYTRFRDFERRILSVAKEALWEKSDIWFDYNVIYSDDKTVNKIVFILYEGILREEEYTTLLNVRKSLDKALRTYYGLLSEDQIQNLLKIVDKDNYENILQALFNVHEEANKERVINKSNYIYSTLMKMFSPEIDEDVLNFTVE